MTHLLAQTTVVETTLVVPMLEGVTTAIVVFIFVCVLYPKMVKNKTHFYAAFAAILLVILLHSLSVMLRESPGFQVFAGAATGLLQLGAILLLFTAAGGLSVKDLAGEMARAYEVIRRGEEEKEVIIPITGEMPRPRQQPAAGAAQSPGEAPPAEKIDLPEGAGWPTKPQPKQGDSSIPLE
jgi:hypothetical protein